MHHPTVNLTGEASLEMMLAAALGLVDEPRAANRNVEYMRGQVELIATLFAVGDMESAKYAITTLLGWPTEGIC